MVASERDLRRAKGERMKTQSAGNLVTWGFPNRGFLLLNFSVGTLPRYQEESLADVFPEKCPVTSKSDLMEPRKMRISSAMDLGPIGPGYLEQDPPRLGHPREGKVLPSATSSTQMSPARGKLWLCCCLKSRLLRQRFPECPQDYIQNIQDSWVPLPSSSSAFLSAHSPGGKLDALTKAVSLNEPCSF